MLSTMSPMTISLMVSDILDKRKMSTAEFADKARLTYSQALQIRRGAYARIDLETLARICDALDVMPGDVFRVENTEIN